MFESASTRQKSVLAAIMAALVAGCSFSSGHDYPDAHLVPDEEGIYLVRGGELMRLDGDREWENETWAWRSSLPANTEFVIFDPSLQYELEQPGQSVRLGEVAWVRSQISSEGDILPNTGSRWAVPKGELFAVPITLQPVAGRGDVLRVTPREPLEDGLYSIQLRKGGTNKSARFGVNWPVLDHNQYAASHCTDIYIGAVGKGDDYRPCEEQQLIVAKGLRVYLVNPRNEQVDGVDTLVVQGIVVNTSGRPRPVPPLTAEVEGPDGTILKQWTFNPSANELAPGQSVSFQTQLTGPPDGTKTVRVKFGQTVAYGD
jgi:hypothetical protein